MKRNLSVNVDDNSTAERLPAATDVERWARAAYAAAADAPAEAELGVAFVDAEESQQLNLQYRHKNKATNVLSFPLMAPLPDGGTLLGDLAICASVVQTEAAATGRTETAHWAHMVVHGVLHLLGYDHEQADQAQAMEMLETRILQELGFADPYEECYNSPPMDQTHAHTTG